MLGLSACRGDNWERYLGDTCSRIDLTLFSATRPEVRPPIVVISPTYQRHEVDAGMRQRSTPATIYGYER